MTLSALTEMPFSIKISVEPQHIFKETLNKACVLKVMVAGEV